MGSDGPPGRGPERRCTRRVRRRARVGRALLGLALAFGAARVGAQEDRVRIAYFLEWPTPNLVAKADRAYEDALGVPVSWHAFDTGTQMTEALLAGRVDIAYSQGLAPFVAAVNAGAPLVAVGVAVEYPANDCVIREGSGIDPEAPSSFAGRTVALPVATMADYSFRMMTRALGVDAASMTVVDRIPSEAAIALLDGEADLACGFGALAMGRMTQAGPLLMDAETKRDAGIRSFDVVTARAAFARDRPALVRAFLAVTERANTTYRGTPNELDRLGLEAGLDRAALLRQLGDFAFPTASVQRESLLAAGGPGLEAMAVVGEAFATDEAPALPDYTDVIDASYLP